jgi:hypothetical protein
LDWALDLMVDADRTWQLKDEQEFAMYQQRGLVGYEEASTVTQILHERVLSDLDARTGPFAEEWKEWSPKTEQAIASLPERCLHYFQVYVEIHPHSYRVDGNASLRQC